MTCVAKYDFSIPQGTDLSVPFRLKEAEAPIAPLTLDTTTKDTEQTAFEVRLTALEEKVEELRSKTWKQEALA